MLTHCGTKRIETSRLILRNLVYEDADSMFRNWAGDLEVTQYLRFEPHEDLEETRRYLHSVAEWYVNPHRYHWGIQLSDGELIGAIGVKVSDEDYSGEVAYCIGKAFWGKGYASEALKAVKHFMFLDVGLNRLEAYHAMENPASGRVLKRAGFTYEGSSRQKYHCRMGFMDSDLYGVLRQDLCAVPPFSGFVDLPKLTDGEIDLYCRARIPGNSAKMLMPAYDFLILRSGKPVGKINLRIGYSDKLYYGGHIGYQVEEGSRGHSYAAKACRLLRPIAASHGMSTLIITNGKNNIASKRTCENIGAELIRVAELPEWTELYQEGERHINVFEWKV